MQIQGLTEEQVEMLDFMWTLDSMEEFDEWKATLDRREQVMADSLQKMVLLAALDDVLEAEKTYPDAKQLLKQFQL
jgi:hypothetical protein